jgi:hypothetical protein
MPSTPFIPATITHPPAKRAYSGIRYSITNIERKALHQYYADIPERAKPIQQVIRTWFLVKYYSIF